MLKVGIIGSGFGVYGLLPAFSLAKNCRVTSIAAKKSPRLLEYVKKYKVPIIYENWHDLLKKEEIDAVALAVVPSAQYKIAKAAIHKKLHIFAEKPLAANYKQAFELNKLANQRRIVTVVDFIFPEIPEWIKAAHLLRGKSLGKVLFVKADWDFLSYDLENKAKSWKTDATQGGGALAFFFSHVLYYIENFVGEINNIKSRLLYSPRSFNGGEVSVDLIFDTKNGVGGNAHLNCNATGIKRHRIMFICENGTLILENKKNVARDFSLSLHKNAKMLGIKVKKNHFSGLDERTGAVKNLVEKFIEGCLQNRPVKPSFNEGLRVQKLIEQIRLESKIKNRI